MAYKTFANGFPLPASDLNNYLMNQSVIVFADSTARSAALPTPTEGMITYLEDTNNYQYWDSAGWVDLVEAPDLSTLIPKSTVTTAGDLIVADGASSVTRLGVGAVDQVLTSDGTNPIWADAAGGGGSLTLLTSGTFTGTTDISGLDQSYKNLKIVLTDVYRSSSFGMQFRNSGTIQRENWFSHEYNGASWSLSQNVNELTMFFNHFDVTPGNGQFIIDIWDYSSTGVRLWTFNANPQSLNARFTYGNGVIRSGLGINEIRVYADSGNYEIYGVN